MYNNLSFQIFKCTLQNNRLHIKYYQSLNSARKRRVTFSVTIWEKSSIVSLNDSAVKVNKKIETY